MKEMLISCAYVILWGAAIGLGVASAILAFELPLHYFNIIQCVTC